MNQTDNIVRKDEAHSATVLACGAHLVGHFTTQLLSQLTNAVPSINGEVLDKSIIEEHALIQLGKRISLATNNKGEAK